MNTLWFCVRQTEKRCVHISEFKSFHACIRNFTTLDGKKIDGQKSNLIDQIREIP